MMASEALFKNSGVIHSVSIRVQYLVIYFTTSVVMWLSYEKGSSSI